MMMIPGFFLVLGLWWWWGGQIVQVKCLHALPICLVSLMDHLLWVFGKCNNLPCNVRLVSGLRVIVGKSNFFVSFWPSLFVLREWIRVFFRIGAWWDLNWVRLK